MGLAEFGGGEQKGGRKSYAGCGRRQMLSVLWGEGPSILEECAWIAEWQLRVRFCDEHKAQRCRCRARVSSHCKRVRAGVEQWARRAENDETNEAEERRTLEWGMMHTMLLAQPEVVGSVAAVREWRGLQETCGAVMKVLTDKMWGSRRWQGSRRREAQAAVRLWNAMMVRCNVEIAVRSSVLPRTVVRPRGASGRAAEKMLAVLSLAGDLITEQDGGGGASAIRRTGGSPDGTVLMRRGKVSTVVYAAVTCAGEQVYIGSTTRGLRQRADEHRRDAYKAGNGDVVKKGSALPFYHQCKARGGMHRHAFFPMIEVAAAEGRRRPARGITGRKVRGGQRGDRAAATRTRNEDTVTAAVIADLQQVERAVQRVLQPRYNTPWCYGKGRHSEVIMQRSRGQRGDDDTDPSLELTGALHDSVTGRAWRPGTGAEYQPTRVTKGKRLSDNALVVLAIRMCRGGRQARGYYPILKRMSNAEAVRFLPVVQRAGGSHWRTGCTAICWRLHGRDDGR